MSRAAWVCSVLIWVIKSLPARGCMREKNQILTLFVHILFWNSEKLSHATHRGHTDPETYCIMINSYIETLAHCWNVRIKQRATLCTVVKATRLKVFASHTNAAWVTAFSVFAHTLSLLCYKQTLRDWIPFDLCCTHMYHAHPCVSFSSAELFRSGGQKKTKNIAHCLDWKPRWYDCIIFPSTLIHISS